MKGKMKEILGLILVCKIFDIVKCFFVFFFFYWYQELINIVSGNGRIWRKFGNLSVNICICSLTVRREIE